ncbi:CesT family type III secretion system chaperone [Variovorax sp. KK3]|uniref:CesT family type III secretion system chaperone n=1 Tax=Variovorax sp. KK3 TaxID=1855728 RepID=UPI00097BA97B|nr:CesT family type III secretion system chaperone [Variovorax sp. KK3]
MNTTEFEDVCRATADALRVEARLDADGRCSLSIDGVEVLVDHDEEGDAFACYVDLGSAEPFNRAGVCEQLLALNLSEHAQHGGSYAFEPQFSRAIFCANFAEASVLGVDELADLLRYYVDKTEHARRVVVDPSIDSHRTEDSTSCLFAGRLA